MSVVVPRNVDPLRPAFMQSHPVQIDQVFDDPDAVLDLIKARAPYVNLAEFHNMHDQLGGANARAWFRTMFEDEIFLQNPLWIAAAKEAFSAEIVQPFKCLLNLNGPMGGGGVHVDLPVYRGLAAHNAPVWLLMNMTYSGLFHPWMVPIASGLCWFYRGAGGVFAYWPNGPDSPPSKITGPLWNTGVMSDNEFMWHGVGAIGTAEDRKKLEGRISSTDRLYYAGNDDWEIRNEDRTVATLSPSQLRIALLWKAYVFLNEAHLASFENDDMDLTLDQVVDIYRDDLAAKGISVPRPADPLNDPKWRKTLDEAYPPAFNEQAAGDYN